MVYDAQAAKFRANVTQEKNISPYFQTFFRCVTNEIKKDVHAYAKINRIG